MARRVGPSARLVALREQAESACDPDLFGREIDALKPTKGRGDDVRVWVAGTAVLRLPRAAAESLGLRLGTRWTEPLATDAVAAGELALAREYAVRSLSARSRTAAQLGRSLAQRGFGKDTIAGVRTWLTERGYLDDRRHAEAMVRSALAGKPVGRRAIEAKLVRAGVDRATIRDVLDDAWDDRDPNADAQDAARRWARIHADRLEPDVARRRLFAHLARRGFDVDAARNATERVLGEHLDAC